MVGTGTVTSSPTGGGTAAASSTSEGAAAGGIRAVAVRGNRWFGVVSLVVAVVVGSLMVVF